MTSLIPWKCFLFNMDGLWSYGFLFVLYGLTSFSTVRAVSITNDCAMKNLTARTDSNFLSSPGYTQGHNGSSCTWIITAERARFVVRLETVESNLRLCFRCSCDSITVYDGPSTNYGVLRRWCGSEKPVLVSTGPSLTLVFNLGSDDNSTGFMMRYQQEISLCQHYLFADGGMNILTSPSYPLAYQNNFVCKWLISAVSGERVTLNVLDIDFNSLSDCAQDYVKIYESDLFFSSDKTFLAQLCSFSNGTTHTSQKSKMILEFHTDSTGTGRGFKLQYTALSDPVSGLKHFELSATSYLQTFSSPNFPNNYPKGIETTWRIRASYTTSTVCVKALYMAIYYSSGCSIDYVEIFDGKYDVSPRLAKLCGNNLPNTICSSSNSMFIKFRSEDLHTDGGFKIQYTQSTNTDSQSSFQIWTVMGPLTIAVIVFTICTCCWCAKKRKDTSSLANRPVYSVYQPEQFQYPSVQFTAAQSPQPPSNPMVTMATAPPSYEDVVKIDTSQKSGLPSYESLSHENQTPTPAPGNQEGSDSSAVTSERM